MRKCCFRCKTMSRSAQRGWTVWETPEDSTHLANGVGQSQGVSGVAHLDTDRNFVSISPTSYKKSSGIRGLDSACLNNGLDVCTLEYMPTLDKGFSKPYISNVQIERFDGVLWFELRTQRMQLYWTILYVTTLYMTQRNLKQHFTS